MDFLYMFASFPPSFYNVIIGNVLIKKTELNSRIILNIKIMKIINKILDTYTDLTINDKKLIRGMNPDLKIIPDLDNDNDLGDEPILFI